MQADRSLRPAVVLSVALSAVAIVVAVVALFALLTRPPGTDPAAEAAPNACRTAAWGAVPSGAALPPGWTVVSARFFVDNVSVTLAAPSASGSTQDSSVFVSVSCFGSDAELALTRGYEAAVAAGATPVSFPVFGEEDYAVASTRTGSTTVALRRGILVAEITGATSLDPAGMQAVVGAVDAAMSNALAASPRPSAAGASASAGAGANSTPGPSEGSAVPSVAPSASAPVISHVAPDLEAILPSVVEGTTLVSQSVSGDTTLKEGAGSQSLIASLAKLGKTGADLQIAEAHDPAGKLLVRLYAFRVKNVKPADLESAIIASWMAAATDKPTPSDVTLGGQKFTKVAYSSGVSDYLYGTGAVVIDIETSDESLVAKVLALIK